MLQSARDYDEMRSSGDEGPHGYEDDPDDAYSPMMEQRGRAGHVPSPIRHGGPPGEVVRQARRQVRPGSREYGQEDQYEFNDGGMARGGINRRPPHRVRAMPNGRRQGARASPRELSPLRPASSGSADHLGGEPAEGEISFGVSSEMSQSDGEQSGPQHARRRPARNLRSQPPLQPSNAYNQQPVPQGRSHNRANGRMQHPPTPIEHDLEGGHFFAEGARSHAVDVRPSPAQTRVDGVQPDMHDAQPVRRRRGKRGGKRGSASRRRGGGGGGQRRRRPRDVRPDYDSRSAQYDSMPVPEGNFDEFGFGPASGEFAPTQAYVEAAADYYGPGDEYADHGPHMDPRHRRGGQRRSLSPVEEDRYDSSDMRSSLRYRGQLPFVHEADILWEEENEDEEDEEGGDSSRRSSKQSSLNGQQLTTEQTPSAQSADQPPEEQTEQQEETTAAPAAATENDAAESQPVRETPLVASPPSLPGPLSPSHEADGAEDEESHLEVSLAAEEVVAEALSKAIALPTDQTQVDSRPSSAGATGAAGGSPRDSDEILAPPAKVGLGGPSAALPRSVLQNASVPVEDLPDQLTERDEITGEVTHPGLKDVLKEHTHAVDYYFPAVELVDRDLKKSGAARQPDLDRPPSPSFYPNPTPLATSARSSTGGPRDHTGVGRAVSDDHGEGAGSSQDEYGDDGASDDMMGAGSDDGGGGAHTTDAEDTDNGLNTTTESQLQQNSPTKRTRRRRRKKRVSTKGGQRRSMSPSGRSRKSSPDKRRGRSLHEVAARQGAPELQSEATDPATEDPLSVFHNAGPKSPLTLAKKKPWRSSIGGVTGSVAAAAAAIGNGVATEESVEFDPDDVPTAPPLMQSDITAAARGAAALNVDRMPPITVDSAALSKSRSKRLSATHNSAARSPDPHASDDEMEHSQPPYDRQKRRSRPSGASQRAAASLQYSPLRGGEERVRSHRGQSPDEARTTGPRRSMSGLSDSEERYFVGAPRRSFQSP